jgi:hypothetical protein
MLYEKDNNANNADMSKIDIKNWVNLNNTKISSINTNELNSDEAYNTIYNKNIEENVENNVINDTFNEVDKINLHKGSFAHNLHPNIEVFANSLLNKIDTLQHTQLDIHHVEMITDRVFHSVEKLKYEIRDIYDYIQKIESRNKNLEAKLDLLITQNEAINKQNTQLQAICENFFSNKLPEIVSENGIYDNSNKNSLNINSHEIYTNKSNEEQSHVLQEDNVKYDIKPQKSSEIKDLLKSKKQIETFIKKNYPDDYLKIKQYNRANMFSWVNKVLGFN